MSQAKTPPPAQSVPQSFVAGLLSYLIPGLGQIYQGRFGKGLMFLVCLLGMFMGGQWLGDWHNVYLPRSDPAPDDNAVVKQSPNLVRDLLARLHFGGQFWIGMAAWPAIWQYSNMPVPNKEKHPFLHNYQKTPDEHELNAYLVARDKTPDLAWVYTVVAGVLNILVIYDAFAGPAHANEEEPAK
jgi:hypothetical protein